MSYLYQNVPVHIRHVADYSLEDNGQGGLEQVELPGFIEVGVEVDGHFKVLHRAKAAGFFADVKRAKAQQSAQPSEQTQ